MENLTEKCQKVIIEFSKRENLTPGQMLSSFQSALLNIAGWVCMCYKYSDDQYEKFMREYADNIRKSVECRFKK